MVNTEGTVHDDAHDGVFATHTSVVEGVLGPAVDVEELSGARRGQPSTLCSVSLISAEGFLISMDGDLLPQATPVGIGYMDPIVGCCFQYLSHG